MTSEELRVAVRYAQFGSDDAVEEMKESVSDMVDLVTKLDRADIESFDLMVHPFRGEGFLREDEPCEERWATFLLEGAPLSEDRYFLVPGRFGVPGEEFGTE